MKTTLAPLENGIFYAAEENPVIGVAGRKANPVDYRLPHEDARKREKDLLSTITSIAPKNIIFLNQVHGGRILILDAMPEKDFSAAGEADAMVTRLPDLCLIIRTADCVPIFLFDRKNGILGAVHSGWKGTRLEIARNTLRLMRSEFGTLPADVAAYILPSIGPESYRVNRDVFDLFSRGRIDRNGGLYLDLWENAELSLLDGGVLPENIINPEICTLQQKSDFFTHRGGDAGRNLNFGFVKA